MFKKILLLICVAFVVVCYAYPCFALPFGTYKGQIGSGESRVEVSMNFGFDGKVKIKSADSETTQYYKLKGNEIIISEDKKFDDNDITVNLDSMYEFNLGAEMFNVEMKNAIGMYVAIGVGAFAVILILLPNRRR